VSDPDTTDAVDSLGRFAVRAMQASLLVLFVYGLATVRLGMAANGALALSVTFLPGLLRREYGYSMHVGLVFWITFSIFLHSVGALGPYRWFPWYDSVTHAVSSSLIAGFGYTLVRVFERHSSDVDVPSEFHGVFVVVFVLAMGVFWEILEFALGGLASLTGTEAALVVMGIDDIVSDMVFNAVGAVVVAVAGTDYFSGVVGFVSRRVGALSRR
jgi:hypothetical protein